MRRNHSREMRRAVFPGANAIATIAPTRQDSARANLTRHHIVLAFSIAIAITFGLLTAWTAQASDSKDPPSIGKADKVLNDVQEQFGAADIGKLSKRQTVYLGHTIVTGPKSGARFRFRDGSYFELGPDGRAILDDFVYSPTESTSGKAIEIVKGTFSAVSGVKAPGHMMTIKTPIATIGIRGSTVQGFHWPGFASMFYLPAGEADIRTKSGESALLKAGDSVVIPHDSQEPGQEVPPAIQLEAAKYMNGRLKPLLPGKKMPGQTRQSLMSEAKLNLIPAVQQHGDKVAVASTKGAELVTANAATEPAAIQHARDKMPLLDQAIGSGYFNSNASSADRDALDGRIGKAKNEKAAAVMGKLTAKLQKTDARIARQAAKQVAAGMALGANSANDIARTVKSISEGNPDLATAAVKGALAIPEKTQRPDIAANVATRAVDGAPAYALEIVKTAIEALPVEDRLEGARVIAKAVTDENPAILAEVNTLVNLTNPDANLHVPEHERERAALAIDAEALGIKNEKIKELEEGQHFDAAKDSFRKEQKKAAKRSGAAPEIRSANSGDSSLPEASSLLENMNWPLVAVIGFGLLFAGLIVYAIMRYVKQSEQ